MSQAGIHHRVCRHDLLFDFVPDSYFEGVPLGNGELGAMLWFEEDRMVLSLDRADIWEHRADQSLEPGMDFATVLCQTRERAAMTPPAGCSTRTGRRIGCGATSCQWGGSSGSCLPRPWPSVLFLHRIAPGNFPKER